MTSSLAASPARSGPGGQERRRARRYGRRQGVVGILVGLVAGGVKDGLRLPETGEGAVPISDREAIRRLIEMGLQYDQPH